MLLAGGTAAARWSDGTLRDAAGDPFLTALTGHNMSELANDVGYVTAAYSPAHPGDWAGTSPATVAEALDRLAAAVRGNGATPVG